MVNLFKMDILTYHIHKMSIKIYSSICFDLLKTNEIPIITDHSLYGIEHLFYVTNAKSYLSIKRGIKNAHERNA